MPLRLRQHLLPPLLMLAAPALAIGALWLGAWLQWGYRFDEPMALLLLLLAAPILWLGRRSLAALEPARRWTAIGLRLAVLIVLVLLLSGLQSLRKHTDVTVVALLDQSESVQRFASPPRGAAQDPNATVEDWAKQWLKQSADDKKADDRFAMIGFDGRPRVRSLPFNQMQMESGAIETPVEGTDVASAIRLGLALFPADSGKRMVLLWDGNETTSDGTGHGGGDFSDVLDAAHEAKAQGIPIDVLPIEYALQNEAMVDAVYTPTEARQGQAVSVRVVLSATAPVRGTLFLKHDGQLVDLDASQPGHGGAVTEQDWTRKLEDAPRPGSAGSAVSVAANGDAAAPGSQPATDAASTYMCVKVVELSMVERGANRFEAIFEPEGQGDHMAGNNRAESFTLVQGKGKILFVDNVGGESGMILPNALASRGIELDVVPGEAVPHDLVAMQRYDAVFLQNVPADLLTVAQQTLLARYVNDLGGGLVMIGGPDSFGAGGWTNSAVDAILPINCQIPSQTILPSGALVLVLDRSGSMGAPVAGTVSSQQEVANEAAVLALATLYPQDLVGVVAFDHVAHEVVKLGPNKDPNLIARQIRSITPRGGTDIYPGLAMAYDQLKNIGPDQAAVKHVILLTDGQSNSAQYASVVGNMYKAGITLSTVGVGDAVNSQLLGQLAQMGGGHYYAVSDPKRLPQVFIKEARTVRKNLIKEQEFSPQLQSTGSPIMAGMPQPPQLKGLVLTGPKHDARVFMPMLGPEGEPLFAHWQVGLGRAAAFTSDATNRWADEWLTWGGYNDFWARTARAIARPSAGRAYDIATALQGDVLKIRLDATGGEGAAGGGDTSGGGGPSGGGAFANFLHVEGIVLKPDGNTTVPVKLEQTGPGIYEASVPAAEAGNYIVNLFAQDAAGKGQPVAVFGGVSRPPGAELRRFTSNRAAVEQIAALTGGRVLDAMNPLDAELYTRESVKESRSIRPLFQPLLVWLLVLFLLDVACRRIAWDLAATRHWVAARVWAMAGVFRRREEKQEQTLAALKARQSATEERLARRAAHGSATAAAAPAVPATNAGAKFEAAPQAVASDDFAAAVGGATPDDGSRPTVVAPARRTATHATGPTTSRLLDAKRRMREQMDEET